MYRLLITYLLALTGSISLIAPAYSFTTLFCKNTPTQSYQTPYATNRQLIKEVVHLDCSTLRISEVGVDSVSEVGIDIDITNWYKVTIEGMGLGLRLASVNMITIACPTVRAKALGVEQFFNENKQGKVKTRNGVTKFRGVKASAAIMVGLDFGLFVNKKGGICTLFGAEALAIGAGVSISKMTVTKR
jgi:hypothetical protein